MPPDTPFPGTPIYAIGDLHGCAGRLGDLVEKLYSEAERSDVRVQLVFLGDYVDRGEQSRQILEWLIDLERTFPDEVVCLMGNHERMLLDFLDDPIAHGERWLRHGGEQTLASFEVGGVTGLARRGPRVGMPAGLRTAFFPWTERAKRGQLVDAAARLRAAFSPGTEDWLRGLRLWWQSGDVVCVHAAMDPLLPPKMQTERALLWGNAKFERYDRPDGLWVVHGHTIVKTGQVRSRRVACDTGAYVTGRLTAAALYPGEPVRFIEV